MCVCKFGRRLSGPPHSEGNHDGLHGSRARTRAARGLQTVQHFRDGLVHSADVRIERVWQQVHLSTLPADTLQVSQVCVEHLAAEYSCERCSVVCAYVDHRCINWQNNKQNKQKNFSLPASLFIHKFNRAQTFDRSELTRPYDMFWHAFSSVFMSIRWWTLTSMIFNKTKVSNQKCRQMYRSISL